MADKVREAAQAVVDLWLSDTVVYVDAEALGNAIDALRAALDPGADAGLPDEYGDGRALPHDVESCEVHDHHPPQTDMPFGWSAALYEPAAPAPAIDAEAGDAGLRALVRAYLDAEAQPAYSWVIESQEARREGRPNREIERMDRIARARVAVEEVLAAPAPAIDAERKTAVTEAVVALCIRHGINPVEFVDAIAAAYEGEP